VRNGLAGVTLKLFGLGLFTQMADEEERYDLQIGERKCTGKIASRGIEHLHSETKPGSLAALLSLSRVFSPFL